VLQLTPDELLTTTRSVRKRLDLSRPVPREIVLECLDLALQAPSGCNRQEWRWVIIDDPEIREVIAGFYREAFDNPPPGAIPEFPGEDLRARNWRAVTGSAVHLRNHLGEVPMLVVPCYAGRVDHVDANRQAEFWGSVMPAIWSFQLALRSRGLGSTWTTAHMRFEKDVATLVGVPYKSFTQCGLLPIAYTIGTDFHPAPRRPASALVHWNQWRTDDLEVARLR
jgi:nitroreductase